MHNFAEVAKDYSSPARGIRVMTEGRYHTLVIPVRVNRVIVRVGLLANHNDGGMGAPTDGCNL